MLNSTISWSLQLMLPSAFIPLISSSLFVSMRSSKKSSSRQLLDNLCNEVVVDALQKTSGLLVPCCVVPQAGADMVEVHHVDQGLQM